jgi:hypothetical protein
VTVKDFLRFYVATSHPQIDKYKPTADAICTVGEWFFAGFTRVTGTNTKAEDRSEVYYVMFPFSHTAWSLLLKGNRLISLVGTTILGARRPRCQQAPTET